MRPLFIAAALAIALPTAILADETDMIRVKSASDVPTTVEKLVGAAAAP